MVFQSVPNHAEAVIEQSLDAQQIVNVLGFRHDGSYDQNRIDELAALVDDWWGNHILPLFDDSIVYFGTVVRGLTNENDLTATDGTNTGNGGIAGSTPPSNVAFVMTHRSGFTGRSARGRTYHAGVSDTVFETGNTVTAAWAASLTSAWAELMTDLSTTTWEFVIISRYTGGAKRPLGISFPVVSTLARNTRIDTQRRRLPED